MRTFTVNGKKYTARQFDFDLICEFEEMGISINDMKKKPTAAIRIYFALCAYEDKAYAGKELQEHMIAGGNVDELVKVMNTEMEESDFFRALNKAAEQETTESQS